MINWIKNNEETAIPLLILLPFILWFIILCFCTRPITYYEYVDLNNNKGTAVYCSNKERVKGGYSLGTPYCKLANGTIISVKEYLPKGDDKE